MDSNTEMQLAGFTRKLQGITARLDAMQTHLTETLIIVRRTETRMVRLAQEQGIDVTTRKDDDRAY